MPFLVRLTAVILFSVLAFICIYIVHRRALVRGYENGYAEGTEDANSPGILGDYVPAATDTVEISQNLTVFWDEQEEWYARTNDMIKGM